MPIEAPLWILGGMEAKLNQCAVQVLDPKQWSKVAIADGMVLGPGLPKFGGAASPQLSGVTRGRGADAFEKAASDP